MNKKRLTLDELNKTNPFEVPEGYFEELPGIVQSRLPMKQENGQHGWAWGKVLAGATLSVVVATLVWFTIPERQSTQFGGMLNQVSDATIIGYLEDEDIPYDDLSGDQSIQNAFSSDSTMMNYFDAIDDSLILEQLEGN